MQVNSIVKIYSSKIKGITNAQIRALEKTSEALHTDVVQSQVMPFKTGNLQNESTFVDYSKSSEGKVSIVTSTPYARRLYYHPEYNFSHAENKNAKGEWYKDYLEGGNKQDFCKNVFKTFFKKEGGI